MISMSRWPCVPKPLPGRDPVLVDDAQRPEAHVLGVVVIGERKRVEGLQPPVVRVPPLVALAQFNHDFLRGIRFFPLGDLLLHLRHVDFPGLGDEFAECTGRQGAGLRVKDHLVAEHHQRRDRADIERRRDFLLFFGIHFREHDVLDGCPRLFRRPVRIRGTVRTRAPRNPRSPWDCR